MKDWIDITAQKFPKEMPRRETRRGNSVSENMSSETARFQVTDLPVISLEIIRLLLSGILLVFGLTRREREIERERVLRVRRAVTDANAHVDTLWNNKDVYQTWSVCKGPHWGVQMIKCWNYRCLTSRYRDDPHGTMIRFSAVPGIGGANIRDLVPQAGSSRVKPENTRATADNMKVIAPP